ncbi:MAG: ABC transporter ATP-binding protein [Thermoleophilia bacterium]
MAQPGHRVTDLEARGLSVGYGSREVLHGLDCPVPDGVVTAIVGANASGKSTLLRTMARLLKPSAGAVMLDGQAIASLPTREVARRLGFLPQSPTAPEALTVEDLVGRGRFPHQRVGRRASKEDRAAVDWALGVTDTSVLRERPVDQLSGGQRQRVWIAMALAQDTPILLLDEPTTYLDLAHQLEVLDLLTSLNRERGRTVVMVLHDLNQACRYADHLVALRDGVVHAAGPPAEVVDAAMVQAVLGVGSRVIPDPVTGTPMVVPLPRDGAPRPGAPG